MRLSSLNILIACILCHYATTESTQTGTGSETRPEVNPIPPPAEVVFCHRPSFYVDFCQNQEEIQHVRSIEDLIMLDVTKLAMNMDQWIHIDIMPTPFAIESKQKVKIKHAMIQLSDSDHRVIGRVAEQIPCLDSGHPQYMNGIGKMSQLYKNPGSRGIKVIECEITDDLSYNYPPTVGIFTFINSSVEAFYVNMKFTLEEAEFIKNREKSVGLYITMLLVDEQKTCYIFRVGQLDEAPSLNSYENVPKTVPVDCHNPGENAFEMESTSEHSPLKMSTPVLMKNVIFSGYEQGVRPRYRMPRLVDPQWNEELNLYNLVFNGLDGEGLTWEEREKRRTEISGLRKPVPLVIENPAEETRISDKAFDDDDTDCDDKMRTKKPEDVKLEVARIYLKCKYERQCIGMPDENCLEEKNCDFVASWGKEGDYVVFGVVADKTTYVAIGVSKDEHMGNDSVTECNREYNGLVYGYTSWNYRKVDEVDGKIESGNTRLRNCAAMQDFTAELINQQTIFCTWKRPINTTIKGINFDLNKPHYILTAIGHESTYGVFGNIGKHEQKFIAVKKAEVLNVYFGKSPFQYFLIKLHGLLMITIWMFIVPVATFSSRYLKATFVKRRIKNYSVWFGLHLILSTITIIVTCLSTLLLLMFNNYDRTKSNNRFNLHAQFGLAICLMVLAQLAIACRLMGEQSHEFYIKFLHGMLGHTLIIFAHACMLLSRYEKDGLPCNIIPSYSVYLGIYVVLHLLMSYQICYSDFVRGRDTSRIYQVFIVDHDDEHDQPHWKQPSRFQTLEAEAYRRRRKNLDDIDIEGIAEGTVIDLHEKDSAMETIEHRKDVEEPGAPMRKVIFIIFTSILGLYTFAYLVMMLMPASWPDCDTMRLLGPGVIYSPGYLYT